MNDYMRTYRDQAVNYLKAFKTSMTMGAMRNDGVIDEQEKKILKKLEKATDKYILELKKLD